MRYLIILISFLSLVSFASSTIDVDYDFIENAFNGIKPVTNKEFNDTINKLTPEPIDNSFKGKLKTFFLGRKYGVNQENKNNLQIQEQDLRGEQGAIEEIKNGIYYIKLLVSIIGTDNKIIPLGNYRIQEKEINNTSMLVFYQGSKEYGMLKLRSFEDDKKGENDIAYSRVDIINDYSIRIVYSTIKDTKCALAHIYK